MIEAASVPCSWLTFQRALPYPFHPYPFSSWLSTQRVHPQVSRPERAEVELKGHTGAVVNVEWMPGSEATLASTTAGDKSDKSLRLVLLLMLMRLMLINPVYLPRGHGPVSLVMVHVALGGWGTKLFIRLASACLHVIVWLSIQEHLLAGSRMSFTPPRDA